MLIANSLVGRGDNGADCKAEESERLRILQYLKSSVGGQVELLDLGAFKLTGLDSLV